MVKNILALKLFEADKKTMFIVLIIGTLQEMCFYSHERATAHFPSLPVYFSALELL